MIHEKDVPTIYFSRILFLDSYFFVAGNILKIDIFNRSRALLEILTTENNKLFNCFMGQHETEIVGDDGHNSMAMRSIAGVLTHFFKCWWFKPGPTKVLYV